MHLKTDIIKLSVLAARHTYGSERLKQLSFERKIDCLGCVSSLVVQHHCLVEKLLLFQPTAQRQDNHRHTVRNMHCQTICT